MMTEGNIIEGIVSVADTRYIGSGDTITFYGVESGRKYTVRMIYLNSQVCVANFNLR